MVVRPVDENGDILPVSGTGDLLHGVRADSLLVSDRLNLLSGEWWENVNWGNAIIDLLKETRYTEADQQTLAGYIASYIRETPGVIDVRDTELSMEGRQFRFSCTVETENGTAEIQYALR